MAFQDQPYDYGRRPPPAHDDERMANPAPKPPMVPNSTLGGGRGAEDDDGRSRPAVRRTMRGREAGHETLRMRMMALAFQDQPYDYVRRPPPAHDERTRTPSRDDTDDGRPRHDMRCCEEAIMLRTRMAAHNLP